MRKYIYGDLLQCDKQKCVAFEWTTKEIWWLWVFIAYEIITYLWKWLSWTLIDSSLESWRWRSCITRKWDSCVVPFQTPQTRASLSHVLWCNWIVCSEYATRESRNSSADFVHVTRCSKFHGIKTRRVSCLLNCALPWCFTVVSVLHTHNSARRLYPRFQHSISRGLPTDTCHLSPSLQSVPCNSSNDTSAFFISRVSLDPPVTRATSHKLRTLVAAAMTISSKTLTATATFDSVTSLSTCTIPAHPCKCTVVSSSSFVNFTSNKLSRCKSYFPSRPKVSRQCQLSWLQA